MTIDDGSPRTADERPWIVRTLGPRPALKFPARVREVLRRTLWVMLWEMLITAALALLGVVAATAGEEQILTMLRETPVRLLALGIFIGPLWEELLFRGAPSLVSDLALRRRTGMRWPLGVVAAVAFAALHAVQPEADATSVEILGLHLNTSGLPIPQFVFGLLLWDLMRRYGFWACALSHMFHNAIYLVLGFLATLATP